MEMLGNFLWFVCGGLLSGMAWIFAGCLWCVTIIGAPIGIQCFKMAELSFFPFGKHVIYEGGAVSFLTNVLWFFLSGIELAIGNFAIGCVLCLTIIGIPFGKQFFKIAGVSFLPFGLEIRTKHVF
jgi:uncharacterized membrane protein YccF (DUF307 family)